MNKVTPEKITVSLTLDQVDAHNNNYNALSEKDFEIYNLLVEKAVAIEDVENSKVYINLVTPVVTAFKTKQEAIDYINTLKISFIPTVSCTPTDISITASYIENDVVNFFLYTAPFEESNLSNTSDYTIEYSTSQSVWIISN